MLDRAVLRRALRPRLTALAALLAAAAGLFGAGAVAAEPLKVAFVYIGPVGDAGWTYAHEQGHRRRKSPARSGQDHLRRKCLRRYAERHPPARHDCEQADRPPFGYGGEPLSYVCSRRSFMRHRLQDRQNVGVY